MRQTVAEVSEGFRPRKNYTRVTPKTRTTYPWKSRAAGRAALVLVGLVGDSRAGLSAELLRNWKGQGVTADYLFRQLNLLFPEMATHYLAERGKPLTAAIVYDRYHKMYYRNDMPRDERGCRSDEHYLAHPVLRPLIPRISRVVMTGRSMTLSDAENWS